MRIGFSGLLLSGDGLLLRGSGLILGGGGLALRGGDLIAGIVGVGPLRLTRRGDRIVLMLLRGADRGVGQG